MYIVGEPFKTALCSVTDYLAAYITLKVPCAREQR